VDQVPGAINSSATLRYSNLLCMEAS